MRGNTSRLLQSTIDKCYATGYSLSMRIRSFAHKGLKHLYAEGTRKGVPADTVDKLSKMFAFLDSVQKAEELRTLPSWRVHTLTGDREGTWSLSVTRNRRLTFRIDDSRLLKSEVL
jgi:proteic killer suppression protein